MLRLLQICNQNEISQEELHFACCTKSTCKKTGIFSKFALLIDDCTFHRNIFVNKPNCHYYKTRKVHAMQINTYEDNFQFLIK